MPLGYRVFQEIERPSAEVVQAIGRHFSADLADSMHKYGAMSTLIRPLYRPMPAFSGPAVTVSIPTGSFSMAKLAMEQCRPGDVLVINALGDIEHALLGGHIAHALKVRGLAGVVVDGAVRDVTELQREQLAVFARGTAVIIGGHDGPGEINVPIACGGVVVYPGDIVVADADGVVVVPRGDAEYVLEKVEALHQRHLASQPAYDRGEIPGMSEVEARMRAAGCEFVGD